MKELFQKAGVEVTKENRKEVDKIIHSTVGIDYKNCSATWKAVKEHVAENEDAFIEKLRSSM
jgi:hypothetical protein